MKRSIQIEGGAWISIREDDDGVSPFERNLMTAAGEQDEDDDLYTVVEDELLALGAALED